MLRFSAKDSLFGFRLATVDFTNDQSLDTVKELTEAVDDLDNALSGTSKSGFEDKIKQNLINKSVAKGYDEAKKEWALKKQWADANGQCELCGHTPIVYHFQIENKLNNNTLILGSECILNYVHLGGFTREELRLYLTRLRQRLSDRRFDAVDRATLDVWDKQDAVYASMKEMLGKLPSDFDTEEYKKRLYRFRRIPGFKLTPDFETYIRNVSVMLDVMYTTYKTTKIHEIPDKIRRKQKRKDSEKLTDEEKLRLFIEFETHLHILFKFGSPTEALDLILKEYRIFLEDGLNKTNEIQARIVADLISYFNTLRSKIGNRSRLKDYILLWQTSVTDMINNIFSDYAASIGNIDGMLSGNVRTVFEPPKQALTYIKDWEKSNFPQKTLYKLISATNYEYEPLSPYVTNISANHPLRKVSNIESADLQDAILTCIDRDEISIDLIDHLVIITNVAVVVPGESIVRNAALMQRLDNSGTLAGAITEAQKAEELAKAKEKELLQEYKDLISDAKAHLDPTNDWEQSFILDMEKKYKKKTDLTPKQLDWLSKIAFRRSIPQAKPSQSSSQSQKVTPTPKKDVTLTEFLELCKETLRPGSEKGFVEDLLRRNYKGWSALTPKQQNWLKDIYSRGRALPQKIL